MEEDQKEEQIDPEKPSEAENTWVYPGVASVEVKGYAV